MAVKDCVLCGKREDIKKGARCYGCVLEKQRERARTEGAKEKRKLYEKQPERIAHRQEIMKDPERRKRLYENKRRYDQTEHGKIKNRERQIKLYLSWKVECFNAYGGPVCMWCGDEYFKGLTIDHINNDGNVHRNVMRKDGHSVDGHGLYLWLRRNNFPPGYQVLCHGCNWIKHVNGGVLPSELKDRLRKTKEIVASPSNEESCQPVSRPIEKENQ